MQVRKQKLELDMEQQTGSIYEKEYVKAVYCHPGPITSWQIDGETMEIVTDFISVGSKVTAVVDCSHEIKRCSLLGRKAMTSLDSILKSRDIALPTNIHLVKTIVFPVVMYGCDCRGPAPADPGYSKRGQRLRPIYL